MRVTNIFDNLKLFFVFVLLKCYHWLSVEFVTTLVCGEQCTDTLQPDLPLQCFLLICGVLSAALCRGDHSSEGID